MHRLKGEAMKTAIMLGQADHYLTGPMTAYHHNLIVRTAPPAYKHIMMTLLLAETGQPVEQILEKMSEVGDMGEWNNEKQNATDNRGKSNTFGGPGNINRVPEKKCFKPY